jgi:superfamily II DNA/RNA helicase
MLPALREYQEDAVESVLLSLRSGVNPLLVAPTGSGKTRIAVEVMKRWQEVYKRPVVFLAHRIELLKQAEDAMRAGGVNGFVMSVFDKDQPDFMNDSLTIWDEAHHVSAEGISALLARFNGPKVAITATPDRLDRQRIEDEGFSLCHEIYIRDLICKGYLVRPMAKKLAVHINGEAGTLEKVLEQVAANVLDEVARHERKRSIAFLPSVQSSKEFAASMCALGAKWAHVDGETPLDQREEAVNWFKQGKLDGLSNVSLFTEGFDCPEVDCVVLLRETKSRALWSQMIGRGLRTSPGKTDCLILDPFWTSGENTLNPADAFTGNPDAFAGSQLGLRDCLADADGADADAEERLLAKFKRLERMKDAKEARERGLIDISVVIPLLGLIPPPEASQGGLMTPSQKALLETHKVYGSNFTEAQARWLLRKLSDRRSQGLATVKQVRKLRQFGHRNAQFINFTTAGQLIGSDWRIKRFSK